LLNDAALTTDQARIDRAYALCFGRPAKAAEQERTLAYLQATPPAAAPVATKVPATPVDPKLEAWTSFCQTLFAAAEFRYVP
jgi:hypothetical protein